MRAICIVVMIAGAVGCGSGSSSCPSGACESEPDASVDAPPIVGCMTDADCADADQCTLDRCIDHSCTRTVQHDGENGFLSTPELSPEWTLANAQGIPVAATYDGKNWLVVYGTAGNPQLLVKRLALDGTLIDSFNLPATVSMIAASGSRVLAVGTDTNGVTGYAIAANNTVTPFLIAGVNANTPFATGVFAGSAGLLVGISYTNGKANDLVYYPNVGQPVQSGQFTPGMNGYSHLVRAAEISGTWSAVWEDQQQRPAHPEIWGTSFGASSIGALGNGAPVIRSVPDTGDPTYFRPEILAIKDKLVLLANRSGLQLDVVALGANMLPASPVTTLPILQQGTTYRPRAVSDGGNALVFVPDCGGGCTNSAYPHLAFRRFARTGGLLDTAAIQIANSTASVPLDGFRVQSASTADGLTLVAYNYTGSSAKVVARTIRTCP